MNYLSNEECSKADTQRKGRDKTFGAMQIVGYGDGTGAGSRG